MAEKQYDVSKKFFRLFQEKQKHRQMLREYYLKRLTSPHATCRLEPDPAVIRFQAMLQYRHEHIRPNAKNISTVLGGLVFPALALLCFFNYWDNKKEKLFRSGSVSYYDRPGKFIL